MCCIAEIAMLIFGIVTLVRGEFALSRTSVVSPPAAYFVGVLLTAPLPVAFSIGIIVGIVGAANGNPNVAADYRTEIAVMEAGIMAFFLVTAFIVAFLNAGPRRPKDTFLPHDEFQPSPGSTPPKDPNNPYAPPTTDNYKDRR